MKDQSFLKGAATIALGGFVAKAIGAIYRVPLLSLIGGRGMGLYQMVYPFYCLLLTVSATGIPSSIAKLVSERYERGESDRSVLLVSLKLFLLIGGLGTLAMIAFSSLLSYAQGEAAVRGGYIALAPAVFLVSAISVFRGFFQGRNRMLPTALSEIVEQIVKVGVGLLLAYFHRQNPERAVRWLLFAVSVSELVALLLMLFFYKRERAPFADLKEGERVTGKTILKLCVPVTLSSAILPITGLVESVLIVRLLSRHTTDAVALYGLFTGGAVTLINLPVSVCYGVAAASVPAVSASNASEKGNRTRKKILYSLLVTLAVSIPCAIGLFAFASPAVKILFRALSAEERSVLVRLVRVFSVSAVTLSCTQTMSACLTGLGHPGHSALSMSVAALIRLLLDFLFVGNAKISVFGAAIAANVCYLVAFLIDLVYNLVITGKRGKRHDYGDRLGGKRRRSHA